MLKKIIVAALLTASAFTVWQSYTQTTDEIVLPSEPANTCRDDAAQRPIENIEEPSFVRIYNVPLDDALQTYTYEMSVKYEVPEFYELFLAVMEHESKFVDSVISSTNDYGLMQINIINHSWLDETLGLTNMLNPEQNIHAGVFMLSKYLLKYEDVSKALMCYNLGERGARNYWSKGIDSTSYSTEILTIYKEYMDNKK